MAASVSRHSSLSSTIKLSLARFIDCSIWPSNRNPLSPSPSRNQVPDNSTVNDQSSAGFPIGGGKINRRSIGEPLSSRQDELRVSTDAPCGSTGGGSSTPL